MEMPKPAAEHRELERPAGTWEGTCRTWFEPGTLADESKVTGRFRPLLDGRFIRHEYEATIEEKPRHGEELIAFNAMTKRFQIAWVDDFQRDVRRRAGHPTVGLENRL